MQKELYDTENFSTGRRKETKFHDVTGGQTFKLFDILEIIDLLDLLFIHSYFVFTGLINSNNEISLGTSRTKLCNDIYLHNLFFNKERFDRWPSSGYIRLLLTMANAICVYVLYNRRMPNARNVRC